MSLQAIMDRLPVPIEIRNEIANIVSPRSTSAWKRPHVQRHQGPCPRDPPANGKCPLMTIPTELRREILSYILPEKKTIYHPSTDTKYSSLVRDILVINKQICEELLIVLYEERTFAVNVFEGIFSGGIEFLNSGRQRLQYKEHFNQIRFKRFQGANDPCGFSRVKNLLLQVYPCIEERQNTTRHDSIYTHFMLCALVKLLRKFNGGFELNTLKIQFMPVPASANVPHPWRVSETHTPKCTSLHGVPNIQVILQPLLSLRRLQAVTLDLPEGLNTSKALDDFTDCFMATVKGSNDFKGVDDHFSYRVECARDMLEDWLHTLRFGNKGRLVDDLGDTDFLDVMDEAETGFGVADEDGFFDMPEVSTASPLPVVAASPGLHPFSSDQVSPFTGSPGIPRLPSPGKGKAKGRSRDLPLRNFDSRFNTSTGSPSPEHKRRKPNDNTSGLSLSADDDNASPGDKNSIKQPSKYQMRLQRSRATHLRQGSSGPQGFSVYAPSASWASPAQGASTQSTNTQPPPAQSTYTQPPPTQTTYTQPPHSAPAPQCNYDYDPFDHDPSTQIFYDTPQFYDQGPRTAPYNQVSFLDMIADRRAAHRSTFASANQPSTSANQSSTSTHAAPSTAPLNQTGFSTFFDLTYPDLSTQLEPQSAPSPQDVSVTRNNNDRARMYELLRDRINSLNEYLNDHTTRAVPGAPLAPLGYTSNNTNNPTHAMRPNNGSQTTINFPTANRFQAITEYIQTANGFHAPDGSGVHDGLVTADQHQSRDSNYLQIAIGTVTEGAGEGTAEKAPEEVNEEAIQADNGSDTTKTEELMFMQAVDMSLTGTGRSHAVTDAVAGASDAATDAVSSPDNTDHNDATCRTGTNTASESFNTDDHLDTRDNMDII